MERTANLDWRVIKGKRILPVHFAIAALATLPLLALMITTPAPWWMQSGFETYPGTFVRVATDSYPLCRPWRDSIPGKHAGPGTHVTPRTGIIMGGAESNFAVLLPRNARVTGIYCGSAPASSSLAECSVRHCPAPTHVQMEDSIYTRGRGVVFSFRSKVAKPDELTKVGFWVLWH